MSTIEWKRGLAPTNTVEFLVTTKKYKIPCGHPLYDLEYIIEAEGSLPLIVAASNIHLQVYSNIRTIKLRSNLETIYQNENCEDLVFADIFSDSGDILLFDHSTFFDGYRIEIEKIDEDQPTNYNLCFTPYFAKKTMIALDDMFNFLGGR